MRLDVQYNYIQIEKNCINYLEKLHSLHIFPVSYQQMYNRGASHWDFRLYLHFLFAFRHPSYYLTEAD